MGEATSAVMDRVVGTAVTSNSFREIHRFGEGLFQVGVFGIGKFFGGPEQLR